jgi:hypothetical protein
MLLRQNIGACHSNLDHIVVGFTSPDTYVIQSVLSKTGMKNQLSLLAQSDFYYPGSIIFASQGLRSALLIIERIVILNIGACHSNLDHIVVGFTSPDTYVIQSASLVLVLLILIFANQGLQSAL